MDLDNYFLYFFIILIILTLFCLIISIFGYLVLRIIKKRVQKWNLNFIESLLLSLGIGISFYISIGYLLSLFNMMNFVFGYLSFIIIDSIFIISLLRKNHFNQIFKDFKDKIKILLRFSENKISLIILAAIIIINFFLQWYVLTRNMGFLYLDPYLWYRTTFNILFTGHIDYERPSFKYPQGFPLFNAGALLISPDYLIVYYFHKLASLFLVSFEIFIIFILLRKIFKKNHLILLGLSLFLISNYFLYYTFPYVSSSLALGLIIISLLIILNKLPYYVMGIYLSAIFLINPMICLFYLFALMLFYIIEILITFNNKVELIRQLKNILGLLISISILLLPYILNLYIIYNRTILDLINVYIRTFTKNGDETIIFTNFFILDLIFPLNYLDGIIDEKLLKTTDQLLSRSINLFIVFTIFAYFIRFKKSRMKSSNKMVVFSKIAFLIVLLTFYLPLFIPISKFISKFSYRMLIIFAVPIIILSLYAIQWLSKKLKDFTEHLIRKSNTYKQLISRNKFTSYIFDLKVLFLASLFLFNFIILIQNPLPMNHYYYENETNEVVFYLRDKAEADSEILKPSIKPSAIFNILYDMNLITLELNKTASLNDLEKEFDKNNIDYFIFPKDYFSNKSLEKKLDLHYKERFSNDKYIIFKIK